MRFATEGNITALAEERWGTAHEPRLSQIMTALIRHTHAFLREVEPTHEEWFAATEYLSQVGQISEDKRKEFILLSDVLGISMLVVMQNARMPSAATPATVLGPFHIDDSPPLAFGANLAADIPGEPVLIRGTVKDVDGTPIANAMLDIWQADEDGLYEAQIPDCEARLRGIHHADGQGRYAFWTIAPKGYAIPMDGPVGALISKTDIAYFRPAHIHFLVSADGYAPLPTHLFREGSDYIDTDVVFGARAELVVPFIEHAPGVAPDGTVMAVPYCTVDYDFVLSPTVSR